MRYERSFRLPARVWLPRALQILLLVFIAGCTATRDSVTVTRVPGYPAPSYYGGGSFGRYTSIYPTTTATDEAVRRGARPGRFGLETLPMTYSHEELWVISRGTEPAVLNSQVSPGSGSLLAKISNQELPMPLKHTDVQDRKSVV